MNDMAHKGFAPTKQCEGCGLSIERREKERAEQWTARRFCCRRCSALTRVDQLHRNRDRWVARDPANKALLDDARRSNWEKGRVKARLAITEKAMGWCPPKYRDLYRTLTQGKRMRAADARAMVEDTIAVDSRKAEIEAIRHANYLKAREVARRVELF